MGYNTKLWMLRNLSFFGQAAAGHAKARDSPPRTLEVHRRPSRVRTATAKVPKPKGSKKEEREGNLEMEEFARMAIESAKKANTALGEPQQRAARSRARKRPEAGKEDSTNPTPQMLSIMKKRKK